MRARKRFGQHFLEPSWVDRVVDAIRPGPADRFLEIGPGRGALTLALARRAREIVAVEIDRDLAPSLAARVPGNVTVIEGDFLQMAPGALTAPGGTLRAAGNLPYNISTPILFRLLAMAEDGARVTDATVMLQREVADRLAATPGTKDWGVLSACQQLRARVEVVLLLPPGAFRPAPKIHSAIARLTYHPPQPAVRSVETFDALVRAVFLLRRKMLSNALVSFANARGLEAGAALEAAGLDGRRRAETLEVAELGRLSDVFASV